LFIHPIHYTVLSNHVSLPESSWFVGYKQLILWCLLKLEMVSEDDDDDDDELVSLIVKSRIDCAFLIGDDPSHCTSLVRTTMPKEWLVAVIVHLQQQPINCSSIPWRS
jgi:hypothetical protein